MTRVCLNYETQRYQLIKPNQQPVYLQYDVRALLNFPNTQVFPLALKHNCMKSSIRLNYLPNQKARRSL